MEIEPKPLNNCFAIDHHGRIGFVEPPRFPANVTPARSSLEPYRPLPQVLSREYAQYKK